MALYVGWRMECNADANVTRKLGESESKGRLSNKRGNEHDWLMK